MIRVRRLFFAIPIPTEVKEILSSIEQKISLPLVRWTKPQNIHVTLFFMGDVEESEIPEVVESFKFVISKHQPFTLSFKNILLAPPHRPPSMVWASFCESESFEKLARDVQKKLGCFIDEKLLHDNSKKKLIPHITLARFKGFVNVRDILLPKFLVPDFKVDKIELVESQLTTGGPIYSSVGSFDLG